MSAPVLTFYFSTGSRYSYLATSQIPLLERRYGVDFRWVPVNGKRIRALRGADPFAGAPVSGQYDWAYREHDAIAWAQFYGIEFVEPRDVEFDVECLLHGVIAAGELGDMRAYAWALAQEVFAKGTWPLDSGVTERVAAAQGFDLDQFRRAADAAADTLEANCAEAVARGAFGTPSIFVGDELFWGNDRLPLVAHRLSEAGSRAPFRVAALDHVVLRSAEPEALVDFYQRLLGVEIERTVGDFLWQLRVGSGLLDIIRAKPADAQTSELAGANMDHFCLRIAPFDVPSLEAELQRLGVEYEIVGEIYGAQGYGPSLYLVDPEGNRVELKAHKAGLV